MYTCIFENVLFILWNSEPQCFLRNYLLPFQSREKLKRKSFLDMKHGQWIIKKEEFLQPISNYQIRMPCFQTLFSDSLKHLAIMGLIFPVLGSIYVRFLSKRGSFSQSIRIILRTFSNSSLTHALQIYWIGRIPRRERGLSKYLKDWR